MTIDRKSESLSGTSCHARWCDLWQYLARGLTCGVGQLCRYVRDWKSIEAHIGTKTAIQVCSSAHVHAQQPLRE